MADKISEINATGPLRTEDDRRRALEALIRKMNEIIRALNELIAPIP